MTVRYQWVKFNPRDFPPNIECCKWVIVEIDDDPRYFNGGVFASGIDHEFSKNDIAEYGPIVERPSD